MGQCTSTPVEINNASNTSNLPCKRPSSQLLMFGANTILLQNKNEHGTVINDHHLNHDIEIITHRDYYRDKDTQKATNHT